MRAFEYENVGQVLMARLEAAVRAEINKRENQKISAEINVIKQNVKDLLQLPETNDSNEFDKWLAKEHSEKEVSSKKEENSSQGTQDKKKIRKMKPNDEFSFFFDNKNVGAIGVRIIDVDIFLEASDSGLTCPIGLYTREEGDDDAQKARFHGYNSVMDIPPQHLDNIRDMFIPSFAYAKEAWEGRIKHLEEAYAAAEQEVTELGEKVAEFERTSATEQTDSSSTSPLETGEETSGTESELDSFRRKLSAAESKQRATQSELNKVKQERESAEDNLFRLEAEVYTQANASLLMMLEMFKEENIAKAHARGKPLVIIPDENQKDARTSVFRRMMSMAEDSGK